MRGRIILKRIIIYTFCANLILGLIPSVFALQNSYAKDDNGNHYGQTKEHANNGNHYGQTKNGNNGNHYGQADQTLAQETNPSQGKLEGKKLTLCQNKEAVLKTTMLRSVTQAQHQLSVFKSIADRTRACYQAQGHTDKEYSDLSVDARTKYAAAKEIVDNLSVQTFACNDADPKQILVTFRDAVAAKNHALADYRSAVKDLIVSVKSAQAQPMHEVEAR